MDRINKIQAINFTGFMMMTILSVMSCRVTEKYQRPIGIADNKLYRDIASTDTSSIAALPWKEIFRDTILQRLIQEGIDHNLDLKIALARIKQAQANLQLSKSVLFPTLDAHASVTNQKPANNIVSASKYIQIYSSSSWEADVWGKLNSSKKAALAALMQSEAFKRVVQTQLIANIASDYYLLMAYDAQLEVTLKTVDIRKLDVETMRQLKESNVVTGAAVLQSEANLYFAEVMLPDFKQNIRVTENALCNLLGRNPGEIKRDSINQQEIRKDLKVGIPIQLLTNRPDVQEAEYQLRYNFELTNLARSYFYPSLTITAEGGWSGKSISEMFSSASLFGNIIGGLVQPIFNQGQNKQRLKVAQARQEEYILAFQKTLLNAGQEVSNALAAYQTASEKIETRSLQISYLQKAVEFTKELLKYSANTNYTDVLTSEQSLLSARLNSVNDNLQQLQAIVLLYHSLGGGWK